jgi:hypothetical protein
MKKLLLIALSLVCQLGFSQGAPNCAEAYSLCNSLGVPFPNTVIEGGGNGGNRACLSTTPNQSWFIFPVSVSGSLNFSISQISTNSNTLIDVDFACFGPFTSHESGCGYLAVGNGDSYTVDCSYSASAIEELNIPNAQAGEYYILLVTNFSGQTGSITINPLAPSTGVIGCSGIHMVSFVDANGNGDFDADESALLYGEFTYADSTTGLQHVIADANGDYTIYNENPGIGYTISYSIPAPYTDYYTINPAVYDNIHSQPASLMETFYFPVTITQPYNDVSIQAISRRAPQPGFNNTTDLVYTNMGTAPASGTISYTLAEGQLFAQLPEDAVNVTATGFELPFTGLMPFSSRTASVVTTTNTQTEPGALLTATASITLEGSDGDSMTDNNTYSLAQTVVASYDPNDIAETHGPEIYVEHFNEENDYLYYTIRFQNMGSAAAQFINIEHTLDEAINPNTVVMLHGSHDYEMERTGTLLKWHLPNIQLPTISVNEPASQGYVYFKAKVYPGIQADSVIPAGASIYFDYNAPVITNTFQTLFVEDISATDVVSKKSFSMYPNPANGSVAINASQGITAVTVYDISGKILLGKTLNNETHTVLPTDNLATGTYFVQVKTQNGVATQKLLKL